MPLTLNVWGGTRLHDVSAVQIKQASPRRLPEVRSVLIPAPYSEQASVVRDESNGSSTRRVPAMHALTYNMFRQQNTLTSHLKALAILFLTLPLLKVIHITKLLHPVFVDSTM